MRTVRFADWPEPVSALGFGCASLGSRIGRKAGIAAVERALAAGITWFDVAPSYGDGEAEAILGEVLGGTKIAVLTKVGLRAQKTGGIGRVARAIARPLVAALPSLRAAIKPARSQSVDRVPLDAAEIKASVELSLKRLRVDRLAVLALHDPLEADVQNEAVLRALDDVKRQGLAARVGVAGSIDNFVVANDLNAAIDVAQFSAASADAARIASFVARGVFPITHSAFALGGAEPLQACFAANPNGVVLASSFRAEHLAANIAAAG